MSRCRSCPIYHRCEKEADQLLYCRHVEMLKKIGQSRRKPSPGVPKLQHSFESGQERTVCEPIAGLH